MKYYTLVNPKIEGTLKTTFKCDTPLEAANEAYAAVSKYFANTLPTFRFSLECDSKLYHYQAEEKLKNDNADYVITQFKGNVDERGFNKSKRAFDKQVGGKHKHHKHHKDDSDSSSSDSSSPYMKWKVPISSWWYYPYMYTVDDLYVFTPSFIPGSTSVLSNIYFPLPSSSVIVA